MSTPEDLRRLIEDLRVRAERAELLADQERREKEKEKARGDELKARGDELKARGDAMAARAAELEARQAPTRLLDYIRGVDQNVFAAFTVERASSALSQGTTAVGGRFYPQHFKPWPDFESTHATLFSTLVRVFDDDGGAYFPSPVSIETTGGDISPAAADEQDLRPFIRASIEKPAARIISKYLDIVQHPTIASIRFRNNAYGLDIGRSDEPELQQHPHDETDQQRQQEQRVMHERRLQKHSSPVKTVGVPDRWAFAERRDEPTTIHILVAEYKAAHRLPAAKIRAVLSAPPTDDFFPRAAKQDGLSSEGKGSVLVAKVLCQAYHYMVTSGLEFGYVASGEGLVLLRVPETDANTLHYVWFVFPSASVPGAEDNTAVPREPQDTAVSYLASLSMLALDSTPRSSEWISDAISRLQRWPGPKVATASPATGPQLRRPDRDGGGGDGGGGGAGGNDGQSASKGLATEQSAAHRGVKRARRSEQAGNNPSTTTTTRTPAVTPSTPSPRRFIVEPPTLPYCTQACLHGLVCGLPLDNKCPNATLHAAAGPCSSSVGATRHALTARDVRACVVAQLAKNMDKDCECLDKYGCFGRYGVLFKITVTGYGYTFVAKGVQYHHRTVLEREAAVYRCLETFQGRLIPICLGVIELERDIPLHSCAFVSHLMLLSFAGPDLGARSLKTKAELFPKDVDWLAETDRTWDELAAAGLRDDDLRERNVAWNAEVGRVMQFDFDQATVLLSPPAPTPTSSLRSCSPPPPSSPLQSPLLSKTDLSAYHDGGMQRDNGLEAAT
ncbi:metalloprotease m41 [Sporothrix brasiliensis 5110]|uniref:Metalloprotease m41 n=1 Tax=Sporothrix brasiliensis 5110 TaxID=1398154 RepID=A0A0C2ELQ8_9PEZI|nr:metalloprotease m41 [Sporothrix brasiliensis 5110]KIH87059.1 metalloprotease m41 [Sporothrix brasiliensis 5110]